MSCGAPLDPVGPGRLNAITWHEVMADYEAAGFTHDEAFKLTRTQLREFWAITYEDAITDSHPD